MIDSGCFSLPLKGCEVRADRRRERRSHVPPLNVPLREKLIERLTKLKLIDGVYDAGDFSAKQYGSRAWISTIDAIEETFQVMRYTVATVVE